MKTSSRKLAKIAAKAFRKNQAQFLGDAFRPRRKWMPRFVWMWLIRLIIKVDD